MIAEFWKLGGVGLPAPPLAALLCDNHGVG